MSRNANLAARTNPHITALSIATFISGGLGLLILIAALIGSNLAYTAVGVGLLVTAFWLWVAITLFAAWAHENDNRQELA